MPDLTPSVKLQPSLLDRLTDDNPAQTQESREQRVISPQQLGQLVRRDLSWLLNATCLEATVPLSACPEVRSSVLNFGIADLTGNILSGLDIEGLVANIRQAVTWFEPRIDPRTLKVTFRDSDNRTIGKGLIIEISGQVWADPIPINLHLKTEVDLQGGSLRVAEV